MREKTTTLERNERLSRSLLWRLMRTFYDQAGLEAWRTEDPVPHYVTSSPTLVQTYSRIIVGYLRDCASSPDHDPAQPVYIVELGAGHGRLGYRLVKRLLGATAGSDLSGVRWVYVLSDLSEHNRAAWAAQPRFRVLVDAGLLDFARFDIGNDESLELTNAGTVLAPGTVANPLVAVANYLFDSLPQDAFYVSAGSLYERRVTLTSTRPDPDIADPSLMGGIDVSCTHEPVSADYYEDPVWNEILAGYRDQLPEAAVLFPVGALDCIRGLERLTGGRLLVLAGDKGWTAEDLLPRGPEPLDFDVHAGRCFSMMVNFHAIARYVEHRQGATLLPARGATSLVVAAILLGQDPRGHPETRRGYVAAVDGFGPDDFYTLLRGVSETWVNMAPQEICAFLHLAGGDDVVLASCMAVLLELAPSLSDGQRQQVRATLRETWDGYLPIGEVVDRAFQYGTLLFELGYYEDALDLFDISAATHGRVASTVYNIGACEFALRRFDRARAAVGEALERDANHEPARALRLAFESAI